MAFSSCACTSKSPEFDVSRDRLLLLGAEAKQVLMVDLEYPERMHKVELNSFARLDDDLFVTQRSASGIAQKQSIQHNEGLSAVFRLDLRTGEVSLTSAPSSLFLWSMDGTNTNTTPDKEDRYLYLLAQNLSMQENSGSVAGRLRARFEVVRFDPVSGEFQTVDDIPAELGVPQRIRVSPGGKWAGVRVKSFATGSRFDDGPRTSIAFVDLESGRYHGSVGADGLLTRSVFIREDALYASTVGGTLHRFNPKALDKQVIDLPTDSSREPVTERRRLLGSAVMLSPFRQDTLIAAVREAGRTRAWIINAQTNEIVREMEVTGEVGWVQASAHAAYFRAYPITVEGWMSKESREKSYEEAFHIVSLTRDTTVANHPLDREPSTVRVDLPGTVIDQSPFYIAPGERPATFN